MNDFPELPGEEKKVAREPGRDEPSSWFRFSLTRLILATAIAPLPLLLIRPGAERYAGWFVASCLALFAAMLTIRARDLPRLNVTITIVAVGSVIFHSPYSVGSEATTVIVLALPAMFVSRLIYPPVAAEDRCELGCDSVIYSALVLNICLNLAICGSLQDSLLGGAALAGMILLLAVNFYWTAVGRSATLDQRPDIGIGCEVTMVLIPSAHLFFLIRAL